MFPFFFVEQKRGWSSILPAVPTHLRIREPHRRTAEFLLGMRAPVIANRRQKLEGEAKRLQNEWTRVVQTINEAAGLIHGTVVDLPSAPDSSWPPKRTPRILVPRNEEWHRLETELDSWRSDLRALLSVEIPRVEDVAPSAEGHLADAERRIHRKEARLARLFSELEFAEEQIRVVGERVAALEEERQKNLDAKTLTEMGGEHFQAITTHECPVCHQHLQDSLIPLGESQSVMSIDLNIEFIKEQMTTYQALLESSRRQRDRLDTRAGALQSELQAAREEIRSLRSTLISDTRLPSASTIRLRLELERQVTDASRTIEKVESELHVLGELSAAWTQNREAVKALAAETASADDHAKVKRWAQSFREQLKAYDFKSVDPPRASISADTLRPEHEGFDFPSGISASDMVRTIWGYLVGLLEIGSREGGRHPGLLVLDEPRQQSTKDVSFAHLLRRASKASSDGRQIIIFTSEDRDRLADSLQGIPHQVYYIEGRVLQVSRRR
jgi:DNA repair exonuclease SbcCD ATPase subunit